ncbi:AraC family transcriptional regulator [Photobacterium gaetbulicola]|uniref:AraC family transcriptional regulator n=1 Tax=Photobacterium gaetbulicola TaxID=1295392 RepID=A0A0B9GKR3_9GAMM|nr:AraC family transcriptional regulator [Photobacterium gaetbulicola]KHT65430.1 AraC family transcriptional regulator [Photobacterium gaetbulicola]
MEYIADYAPSANDYTYGILDIQLLVKMLEKEGIAVETLLSGCNLTPDDLASPNTHIRYRDKLAVFANAIDLSSQPGLGLLVGNQARFSDFGVLGYAVFSSATLGEALLIGFKYLRLAGPVLRKKMWINGDIGGFSGEELLELDAKLLRFCAEYWFSAIKSLCEEVTQTRFPAQKLYFPFPEPSYSHLYQEIFQCPVVFNSNKLEWHFDSEWLARPLPTTNPLTLKMCLQSCEDMLSKLSHPTTLADKVSLLFVECSGRYPNIEQVADHFSMSSRTLRRRLTNLGTSYQSLLDQVRSNLAKDYLKTTHMSLDEIAERIGFSDSANFRHAFQKWTGISPSQYRKNTRPADKT